MANAVVITGYVGKDAVKKTTWSQEARKSGWPAVPVCVALARFDLLVLQTTAH